MICIILFWNYFCPSAKGSWSWSSTRLNITTGMRTLPFRSSRWQTELVTLRHIYLISLLSCASLYVSIDISVPKCSVTSLSYPLWCSGELKRMLNYWPMLSIRHLIPNVIAKNFQNCGNNVSSCPAQILQAITILKRPLEVI